MKGIQRYCLLMLLVSCQALGERKQKQLTSPGGYDLENPERFRVRESMQEISGLVYHQDEDHFMAINDEQGKIFRLSLRARAAYPTSKFGKGGDYEELVHTGKDWLVLKSNGNLHHIQHLFTDSVDAVTYHFPEKKNEFEAAYYDPAQNSILVICKDCEGDREQGVISVYAFTMDGKQFAPAYQFKEADIRKLEASSSRHFKPSGAAIHPVEKRLYILASANQLLVITDLQGRILESHHLDSKRFNQPEGITFAPNGDMYISNEGDDENTADILKFSYRP